MTTDRNVRASNDTRSDNTSQDAALRGASLAFRKPPVKPKPQANTYSGSNGALAAATKVGGRGAGGGHTSQHETRASPSRFESEGDEQKLGYHNTGGSTGSSVNLGKPSRSPSTQRMSRLNSTGFLQPPGTTEQVKSPSFIAATLAASRSASISPHTTGQQISAAEFRRQNSFNRGAPTSMRSSSRESADRVLDTNSIPPTTSLIGMFEKNATLSQQERRPPVNRNTSTRSPNPPKPKAPFPRARAPTPEFQSRPQDKDVPLEPRHRSSSPPLLKQRPVVRAPKPLLSQASLAAQKTAPPKPSSSSQRAASISVARPIPIPNARNKQSVIEEPTAQSSSSNESFVSASDHRPSPTFRAVLATQNRQLQSSSAISTNSTTTINSMANAIVASSLASSRAASPSKQLTIPPAPPPRRSPRSHSHLFHHTKDLSRTPSPSKQSTLRTTMRKPRLEEDVDLGDKRRSKKHIMKKHPNKHHEGDRKRWRDEITERERKRYEAVWASNRGLHIHPSIPGSENSVCNLVVRDIFSRSRLHDDVLEEVYALVDRGRNGVLEKEEFVVGLWLVDQRLKGRKLPLRVSDHVWRSVGMLNGIKVRKAGK